MSRFLLVVATLLGKNRAITPRRLSKCYVDAYGADTFRLYEMFIGPFDQVAMWSDESLMGVYRFVSKVYALMKKVSQLPYDVIASKPVSSFMAEQVVTPEQQILVG